MTNTFQIELSDAERLRVSYRWATVEMAVQSLAQSQAIFAQQEIEQSPEWFDAIASAAQAGIDPHDRDAVIVHGFSEGIITPASDRAIPEPPVVDPGPQPVAVVTMRQAKIMLSRAGILGAANAAIEAMEGQDGEEARIEWATATELRRDHPLVAGLGQVLGLDDAAIDSLFEQAALIS